MTIEVSAHLGSRLQDAGYLEESAFWVSNSFRFCFILKARTFHNSRTLTGNPHAKPALKLRPCNRTTLPFQYVLLAFALVVIGCFASRGLPCRSQAHRSRGLRLEVLEAIQLRTPLVSPTPQAEKSEMSRRLPSEQRRRCTCG